MKLKLKPNMGLTTKKVGFVKRNVVYKKVIELNVDEFIDVKPDDVAEMILEQNSNIVIGEGQMSEDDIIKAGEDITEVLKELSEIEDLTSLSKKELDAYGKKLGVTNLKKMNKTETAEAIEAQCQEIVNGLTEND